MAYDSNEVERRFLLELRRHLVGWKGKITSDFSKEAYDRELAALAGDGVYSMFCFDNPTYVLIRLMGRMSISIGRRLGEIYDKIPRFVVQARFGLTADEVGPKIHDELNLDIGIPYSSRRLSEEDRKHIITCANKYLGVDTSQRSGLGIEIRYNFNPNDSARLRKDDSMARYLLEDGMVPVYVIFSSISPRDEAIQRLTRTGWTFLVGDKAVNFMRELTDMDLRTILDRPAIKEEVADEVAAIMKEIMISPAFADAVKEFYDSK